MARLQGKKSRLFHNWEKLIFSSDLPKLLQDSPANQYLAEYNNLGVWRYLNHEYQWVFRRMNPSLRKTFGPYFVFQQMESLLVALRYLYKKGSSEELALLLNSTLLNHDVQEILLSKEEFSLILRKLEKELVRISKNFEGLSIRYRENGFADLEMSLKEDLFVHVSNMRTNKFLTAFFEKLIDNHNYIILAKSIRWKVKEKPCFLADGNLAIDLFEKSFAKQSLLHLARNFHLNVLQDAQPSVSAIETALLKNITGTLKTWSRFRSATAYILFYLWEQFRYTRNMSMLLHTAMVDDELVAEHIII